MNLLRPHFQHHWHRPTLRRWVGFCVIATLVVLAGWAAKVTRAEFEVPLVETTNFVAAEFKSVWGYRRATKYSGTFENYQAFAVGKPGDATHGTTAIYQFVGDTWKKMLPLGPSKMEKVQLNAIAGQYDPGSGTADLVNFAGRTISNRKAFLLTMVNYPTSTLGYDPDPIRVGEGLLVADGSYNETSSDRSSSSALVVDFIDQSGNYIPPSAIPSNSELYAINAAQDFGGFAMAGGMNGWIATRQTRLSKPCFDSFLSNYLEFCDQEILASPGAQGYTLDEVQASRERWKLFRLNNAAENLNAPTTSDAITGIAYTSPDTAYVATSTFFGFTTAPYDPFGRSCFSIVTPQTSKLFRVVGPADVLSNWTQIATVTGECFYGLTASPLDTEDAPPTNHGPLQTNVWIASSKGVRRVVDNNITAPLELNDSSLVKDITTDTDPKINGKRVYGVAALYERFGDLQQLALNGNFESWLKPLTGGSINDPAVNPSGWIVSRESGNKIKDAGGNCVEGTREVAMVANDTATSDWAIKIEPGLAYNKDNCVELSPDSYKRVVSVAQRVFPSDIEGTKFRVRGKYRVTNLNTNAAPVQPAVRQGGVALACAGAYPPSIVECPYQNLRELQAFTATSPSMTEYKSFSFEFTRSNNQLSVPSKGSSSQLGTSNEGLTLVIRCQATFGVRVECDDLRIELVDDPLLPARSAVTVLAVGEKGLTLRNDDAVARPATNWKVDDQTLISLPAGNQITLNAVANIGDQRTFAVGSGTALFQRSPGNIGGFAWLGAAQEGPTGPAGLGWLATNCANFRDANSRSLCQRHSRSFGLTLEGTSLTGRAWFGKQITSASSDSAFEGIDAGVCQNPAQHPSISNSYAVEKLPYESCDKSKYTCVANRSKACYTNFDCFGRCSKDSSRLCLADTDCTAFTPLTVPSLTFSGLNDAPPRTLVCNATRGSSPNACTSGGWLTFNAEDLPAANQPPDGAPGSTFAASYDEVTGALSGWGRFMTLANTADPNYTADKGWVSLRGASSSPTFTSLSIYGAQSCGAIVKRCQNNLPKNCNLLAGGENCAADEGKCISVSSCQFGFDKTLQSCRPAAATCSKFCGGDRAMPCSSDTECSDLWGSTKSCETVGYCSNSFSTPCSADSICGTGFCVTGAICQRAGPNSCNSYGVNHDATTGRFQGFAWSSDYGWIDFRGVRKGTSRFLQTRLGDVYSGGDIGSAATVPSTSCNATYIISATGTINNFCTTLKTGITGFDSAQGAVASIPILSSKNDYSNALGRFDLTGLETVTKTVGAQNFNKYDMEIVTVAPNAGALTYDNSPFSDPDNNAATPTLLNRKVYVADCRTGCSLTEALNIRNGTGTENGAGLLVVNGNLTIQNNMQYVASVVDDLRNLGSLVVVVRGDLNIKNTVTNLIGAYYVDGTVFTTPNANKDDSDNRYPLTIRGLMIAKAFELNRKFAGTIESPLPSELFIFDGRLQSNPLPGMIDFASALPNTFNSSP